MPRPDSLINNFNKQFCSKDSKSIQQLQCKTVYSVITVAMQTWGAPEKTEGKGKFYVRFTVNVQLWKHHNISTSIVAEEQKNILK
jgi:hypothetical protein